jgi:hypothetical protein
VSGNNITETFSTVSKNSYIKRSATFGILKPEWWGIQLTKVEKYQEKGNL